MYQIMIYSVAELFKHRIKEMKLDLKSFCKKYRLANSHVSQQLGGKVSITEPQFQLFCRELDFNPDELRKEFPCDFRPAPRFGLRATGEPPVYIHSRDRKK